MYKIGDRVGIEIKAEKLYGVVAGGDTRHGVITVAIGDNRIIQARECDLWYDEGYARLKQGKYNG